MSIFSPPNERTVVVAFLRKHTNLLALAQLLEDGAHWRTLAELRTYCDRHGIKLKQEVDSDGLDLV